MEDRGKSELDLLREEVGELRTELEELKAEEAEEQEPKRPNLRLIQGGLLAGIGGWLWGHRAQAVVALAAGAVGSAAVVLMPHYSQPNDMQVPVHTPASTPERSRDLPEPRPLQARTTKASDGPVRTGTKMPVPTRPSSAVSKAPDDLVPSTPVPTVGVTIPTPVGTVAPTLPRPTVPADALPSPTVPKPPTGSGSCKATIVTVTICIPAKP